MAAKCEHAIQVVDVLFQLGHADYDAWQTGQFRALAGLSSGHHAYVVEIGSDFLQNSLH
jgi:hypothetical protein